MNKQTQLRRNIARGFAICVLASTAYLSCSTAQAQEDSGATPKPVPPEGPLIQKRAPDFSSWSITQRLPNAPKGKAQAADDPKKQDSQGVIQKTTYVKTGDVVHTEIIDSEHHTWNIWVKGDLQLIEWPDHKTIGNAAAPTGAGQFNPLYVDFKSSDFRGFEWISADNYVGTVSMGGKQCLAFKANVKSVSKSKPGLNNGLSDDLAAYTDLETRLPIALSNKFGVSVYQFLSTPAAMQTLPPNVQAFVDKEQQAKQLLTRQANTPY